MNTLTRQANRALTTLVLLSLYACGGGGGGGSSGPPPVTAPSGLAYTSPQNYTINVAISALTPTVTGTVTSYSVTPALPAGLTLNATTGTISGTPTAISASANYVVTATNGGGNTNATLAIAVNDVAPAIAYTPASKRMATGAAYSLTPTATGGAVTGWTVTPALPAGLAINAATGVISGTPTATAAQATYQVRAQNSGGQSTFDLSLTVFQGTLLELGHASGVVTVLYAGTRVASIDELGHWALWNYASGAVIAKGNVQCAGIGDCGKRIALAGTTFVSLQYSATAERASGYEVRDATSGAVVSTIPSGIPSATWWQLATDGNYVAFGDATGLELWSRAGARVFRRDGDYSHANVFAAPAQLRVALGPQGADVIENLAIGDGSSTHTSTFSGTFRTWFTDGEKFLTLAGSTVTTYSRMAVQLDITPLTAPPGAGALFGGGGNFFWVTAASAPRYLYFYRVGSGAPQADSYLLAPGMEVFPSGAFLGVVAENQVSVFDLSAPSTPTRTDFPVTSAEYFGSSAFAAVGAGDWIVGSTGGWLIDGASLSTTPRRLGLGNVTSLTANSTRAVVALVRGDMLVINVGTHAIEGTIPFAASSVKLSPDGGRLGAKGSTSPAPPLKIYAMPARTEVFEWTYGPGLGNELGEFSWSADGSVLAQSTGNLARDSATMLTRSAGPPLGGPATFTNTITFDSFDMFSLPAWPWVRMAPNGHDFALSSGTEFATVGTDIYLNGVLTSAVTGSCMGWVDDNRFLADRFIPNGRPGRYNGSVLYQRDGTKVRDVVFPGRPVSFETVSASSVYIPALNAIYSLDNPTDTAVELWHSSNTAQQTSNALPSGTLAGQFVLFVSNGELRLEPY